MNSIKNLPFFLYVLIERQYKSCKYSEIKTTKLMEICNGFYEKECAFYLNSSKLYKTFNIFNFFLNN